MFQAAFKASETLLQNDNHLVTGAPNLHSKFLPERYSLAHLYNEVVNSDDDKSDRGGLHKLIVLNSCLANTARLERAENEVQHAMAISLWISKFILPSGDIVPYDEMPENNDPAARERATILAQQNGNTGVECLRLLHDLIPSSTKDNLSLLCLIAFSSSRDIWTTPFSSASASHILSQYTNQIHGDEFIVTFLLQGFIRPLFSRAKPDTITATGRKAIPSSAPRKPFDITEMERASRPWKYDSIYSVAVLRWAIENASQQTTTQSWHLFIPPLLTLLDDMSTRHRVSGLAMLTVFLPSLSPKLLTQTGLSSVFEEAIIPILLYLPSITPVNESLQLLPAAYKALFTLCSIRFPDTVVLNSEELRDKLKFLDRVMRKGILTGYLHASEHQEVVQELVTELGLLIKLLNVHCIKHLPHILPILTTTLSDPFSTANPNLLLSAIGTLQTLILNAWPRMCDDGHRMAIVKAIVLCWRSVGDEIMEKKRVSDEIALLKHLAEQISIAGHLLVTAAKQCGVDIIVDLMPLAQSDESLRSVFKLDNFD